MGQAKSIFSVCGMCSVRCPMQVHFSESASVSHGQASDGAGDEAGDETGDKAGKQASTKDIEARKIKWLQGNPYSGLKGALCARGAAGIALLHDSERPQGPLIREGERGEGKWRSVSWDEAFDYVADKLKAIMAEHGPESVLFSDRGGPFVDLHQAFVRGLGSPNYCNHDSACARNVQHAARSVFGIGRKEVIYDYSSCKHLILQSRNIFEGLNVGEANSVLNCLEKGCKLTVIDVRGTVTASKADTFLLINPATDYALNLAVINVLISEKLYNSSYVERHVQDFDALQEFVKPYTPAWAEVETGITANQIEDLARSIAEAVPAVIWHAGWMTARYRDSFYVSRTAYIINTLLGSFGAKGGLVLPSGPKDVGRKGLNKLTPLFPKPTAKRADGAGWKHTHIDAGVGLVNLAYDAIVSDEPYPVRAYWCHRHDPLTAFPDPSALKKKWEKLDLFVSSTFSWSDTAWFADVILPMSTFLERESILGAKSGLKPQFFMRQRAIDPIYDTKADWEIFAGIAKRLGIEPLAFESIEDIWNFQLEGTGVSIEDFAAKGFVELTDTPNYHDFDTYVFSTPSGKAEMLSAKWSKPDLESLKPYVSPQRVPEGAFRFTLGRCAVHTQGHTVNNALLHELMPENVLWIHTKRAEEMDISTGDMLEVRPYNYEESSGTVRAFVTDAIHPEAVFAVHGFGHQLPVESRAFGKGLSDNELMRGGLEISDPAGGAVAMQEHFIVVRKYCDK